MLSWMLAFFFWLLRIGRPGFTCRSCNSVGVIWPKEGAQDMFVLLDQFAWDQFFDLNTDHDFKVLHVFLSDRLILGHLWAMYDPPLTYICFVFSSSFWDFSGWKPLSKFQFISHPVHVDEAHRPALTTPPLVLMTESSDRTQEQCFFPSANTAWVVAKQSYNIL